MAVTLKCAACGADVEFEEPSSTEEATCPGCEVRVRYREGDKQMAIPVSMALPDKFQPIDLDSVADKSSLLVGRYRKQVEDSGSGNSDLVLAKALETLASSIGHLEERLTRHEQGETDEPDAPPESTGGNGQTNGVKVASDDDQDIDEDMDEVVQLDPDEEGEGRGTIKADPVGARVLVRREAAREAQQFRREGHADWDDHSHGARSRGPTGFGWLMEHYPKATILITLLLAGGLIVMTMAAMNEMFATPADRDKVGPEKEAGKPLSQLMTDDPEAAMAETMARGFLNATTAKSAEPFIFEVEAIREKFERYYQPIPTPGEYDLKLKSRALAPGGQSVFAYRVAMPGEDARMLVVLPEGQMPKVFWEFFAEVGDVSWEDFMAQRPQEPVAMRVWVYPGDNYFKPYDRDDWQSYILHDYAENRKVYAFADRGASGDWRINDALKNEPVQFNRHSAVMALVKMTYRSDLPAAAGSGVMVEIKEVVATSWLPERFQAPRKEKK
ncbi:MAG: hypothetical protein GWO24_20855 [Akkermansiaceae bacterium]|nr:hypothetical protein [Akkermansiaceae bacterium]